MNFTELYIKGMLAQQAEKERTDNEGELRYRGGNAGFMIAGIPANSCARKMIARTHGRFEETSWNTQLMFDLGELNEDRWHAKLRSAGLTVRSADGEVTAHTAKGRPITGSPDSLIVEKGENKFLIEHKHISSFWTFKDKVIGGKPSPEHLAQAGFYAMHLNDIPFCVLYTSSVKFSGPSFLTNLVPKPNEPGSENFEYTYYRYTGKIKTYKGKKTKEKSKIPVPGHMNGMFPKDLFELLEADFAEFKSTVPTAVQYDLRFEEDGTVSYKAPGRAWTRSIVTKKNIMEFYNHAEEKEERKELPDRPLTLDVLGESAGYSSCDYCSLSDVCNKYEDDFEVWLKQAKDVRW